MADGFQPTPGQQYPHTVNTQDQSLQNYQSIIEEARQLYGNAKPSFARSSTLVKLGDTKQVVLATVDGRYPNRQDAIAFATLTAGKFNDKYNCWTMDLKGERIIVDMMACGTSSGYRQTLGVEGDSMAYTAYNVAFNVKSTAFDSASENNSSTGSSGNEFEPLCRCCQLTHSVVNVAPRTRNAPSKGPKPTPRSKPPQSRNLRLHHSNLNIDDDDQRIEGKLKFPLLWLRSGLSLQSHVPQGQNDLREVTDLLYVAIDSRLRPKLQC